MFAVSIGAFVNPGIGVITHHSLSKCLLLGESLALNANTIEGWEDAMLLVGVSALVYPCVGVIANNSLGEGLLPLLGESLAVDAHTWEWRGETMLLSSVGALINPGIGIITNNAFYLSKSLALNAHPSEGNVAFSAVLLVCESALVHPRIRIISHYTRNSDRISFLAYQTEE